MEKARSPINQALAIKLITIIIFLNPGAKVQLEKDQASGSTYLSEVDSPTLESKSALSFNDIHRRAN